MADVVTYYEVPAKEIVVFSSECDEACRATNPLAPADGKAWKGAAGARESSVELKVSSS